MLDFPNRKALERELTTQKYDIVGISSIIVNVGKVPEMCHIVRPLSPTSVIVVGRHVTAIPGIEKMVNADHFVKGYGISWMRRYRGEDPCDSSPIQIHEIPSSTSSRVEHFRIAFTEENRVYTPVPGTPLYSEMEKQGRLLPNVELSGIHGQDKFNFRHEAISRDDSKLFFG